MRRGVIVLLKLSGLYMAYRGVSFFLSLWFFFAARAGGGELASELNLGMQMVGIVGYALLSLVAAWVLIARAGRLADWLGVPDEDEGKGAVPAIETMVPAGVKLLGIFLCATALPEFLQHVSQASISGQFGIGGYAVTNTLASLVKLVIALLLMLRGRQIVALIGKAEAARGLRVAAIVCAAVILLALLVYGIATHPWWQQSRYSRHSPVVSSSLRVPDEQVPDPEPKWYAVPDEESEETNTATLTVEVPLP